MRGNWNWKHKYGVPVGVDETSNIVLAEKKWSAGAEMTKTSSMEAMLMLNRPWSTGLRKTCVQSYPVTRRGVQY